LSISDLCNGPSLPNWSAPYIPGYLSSSQSFIAISFTV
jgi:hypothetical protein